MIGKLVIFSLLPIMFSGVANAEFTETSFRCFSENGEAVFTIGEYIERGGYGQEILRYDRTDFDMKFANDLKSKGLFGFRTTGPVYLNHKNIVHSNGDRTTIIGNGRKGEFLFIFKPEKSGVSLEIWKWSNQLHTGHTLLSGDELVFQVTYVCD